VQTYVKADCRAPTVIVFHTVVVKMKILMRISVVVVPKFDRPFFVLSRIHLYYFLKTFHGIAPTNFPVILLQISNPRQKHNQSGGRGSNHKFWMLALNCVLQTLLIGRNWRICWTMTLLGWLTYPLPALAGRTDRLVVTKVESLARCYCYIHNDNVAEKWVTN